MSRWLCSALLLSTVVLGSVSFAHAGSVFLDFQGLPNTPGPIPLGDFYNGGVANIPNYGVTFSNFVGAKSVHQGGSGNFSSNPTQTDAIFLCTASCPNSINGTALTGAINVGPGFTGGVNFYYTAAFSTTVTVWSGANGGGTVLATINLSPNNSSCGGSFCIWTNVSLNFNGTAKSVTFSGQANGLGLSDITLGQSSTAIPEPSSVYLFGFGMAGIWAGQIRRFLS